jgi:hypothetical protein
MNGYSDEIVRCTLLLIQDIQTKGKGFVYYGSASGLVTNACMECRRKPGQTLILVGSPNGADFVVPVLASAGE